VTARKGTQQMSPERRARVRRALLRKYGPICQLCFTRIDLHVLYPDPWSWSVDHIQPVALGGTNMMTNLRPAHRRCNEARGAAR